MSVSAHPETPLGPFAATVRIVSIVLLTFLCYLSIGLQLAVLPSYVHGTLGFGSVLAGLAVSIQYAATVLSRSHAGRMSDTVGPKQTVLTGLAACAASGVFLLLAYAFERSPGLSLAALLPARLLLGFGESWVGTGCLTWAIGRVGSEHTARVISWNGISSYGGLALGAPLGVGLAQHWSFGAMGAAVLGLGLLGIGLAMPRARVPVAGGHRLSFRSVVARVFAHGMALGLGSVGFGSLAAFVTLYYASRQWEGAALALSVFGAVFIGTRLVLGGTLRRFGGFNVALACLGVEALGLLALWLAPNPDVALLGAGLTGCGFSLLFPSLGIEAVKRVPAGSRGAALAVYSVFLDLALAITGPVAGYISTGFGFAAIYFMAACAVLAGAGLTAALRRGWASGPAEAH